MKKIIALISFLFLASVSQATAGTNKTITIKADSFRVCGNEQNVNYTVRMRQEISRLKRQYEKQGYTVVVVKADTTERTYAECRYN